MEPDLLAYLGVEVIQEEPNRQLETTEIPNPPILTQDEPIDTMELETDENANSGITCEDCDNSLSTKSNVTRHRKIHTGSMIPCNLKNNFIVITMCKDTKIPPTTITDLTDFTSCSKTFKSKLGLKYHQMEHRNEFK